MSKSWLAVFVAMAICQLDGYITIARVRRKLRSIVPVEMEN